MKSLAVWAIVSATFLSDVHAADSRSERVARRPSITERFIPFGEKRKAEMVDYARRHYGSFRRPTYRLKRARVIVEHLTATSTFSQAYNTFVSDQSDTELYELPGTCAHFIVGRDGRIYQLVPIAIMCRHTVGLNWTAIGIEHVGLSDQALLSDQRQLRGSIALTCWLRARFGIKLRNVIGHSESLGSPFHREDVASLRRQTHGDMARGSMQHYRGQLRRSCPQ